MGLMSIYNVYMYDMCVKMYNVLYSYLILKKNNTFGELTHILWLANNAQEDVLCQFRSSGLLKLPISVNLDDASGGCNAPKYTASYY